MLHKINFNDNKAITKQLISVGTEMKFINIRITTHLKATPILLIDNRLYLVTENSFTHNICEHIFHRVTTLSH